MKKGFIFVKKKNMKQSVILNVSDLQKFCSKAKYVVPKNPTLPILSYILFKEGKMSATDLETAVVMQVNIDENFEGTLEFSDVVKLLPLLKGGLIDLSIEVEDTEEGKKFHATLSTKIGDFKSEAADPDFFPRIHDTGDDAGTLYAAEVPLIRKALNYASTDYQRPVLSQIRLDKKHVVATDTMAMCYYPVITDTPYNLTIAKEVVKLLDEVDYNVNKTKYNVCLFDGHFTIIYRIELDEYPNWERAIPLDSSSVVTVKAKDLAEVLKASLLVIDKKGCFHVNSKPSEGAMVFSCKNENKTFERAINTVGAGDPIEIGIAYRYLNRLVQTEKTDEFDLSFVDPSTCIAINDNVLIFPTIF